MGDGLGAGVVEGWQHSFGVIGTVDIVSVKCYPESYFLALYPLFLCLIHLLVTSCKVINSELIFFLILFSMFYIKLVSASLTITSFLSYRAGYLVYLIERAKKCLDFAATLYIFHLFICIVYGGWPSSMTWWVVNGTGLVVMSLLGEYLCIKRELREIPITRLRSSKASFLKEINN